MAVDFRSSFRSLTLLLFFSSLGSVRLTAEYDRNFAETDNVQRSASISKERGISAALYSDLVAAAITKTSRRRIGETTAYPTSYPTGVYVAPTNPEEESNTPAPVADASDVPEQNSGEDPNAPVIGSGSTIEEQTSPPVAAPIEPPVEVDTDSSIPITGVAISDNYEIGGAQNINEEIKEEDRTALNSALYFFITLVVCLLCFGGIHIVKSCRRGNRSSEDMKPKYVLLGTTDVNEDEDGEFFSNRNIELARRPGAPSPLPNSGSSLGDSTTV